jgi:hypothetical protein
VRLIVPAARVRDVRSMGEGERHARFSLESASGRARGVAFGVNGSLAAAAEASALDVSLSLEVNHWNGAVEPRVVLGELYDDPRPAVQAADPWPDERQWARRVEAELGRRLEPSSHAGAHRAPGRRTVVDRRGRSGVATVAALASSGETVLVVCADALRRRALVERAATPARFGGGTMVLAGGGLCDAAVGESLARLMEAAGGVALADWARLEREPGILGGFEHVVLIDPPSSATVEDEVDRAGPAGFLHLAWGPAEVELSLRIWDSEWPSRPALAEVYRALSQASVGDGEVSGEALRAALDGAGAHRRSPEVAGRLLRVLVELGLVEARRGPGSLPAQGLRVVSSDGTDLTRSEAFGAYRARHEEGRRYLSRRRNPE